MSNVDLILLDACAILQAFPDEESSPRKEGKVAG